MDDGPLPTVERVMRWWLALGGINGGLSVAAGAFGAHALRTRIEPEALAVFERAGDYHMAHALALIAAGLLAGRAGWTASVAGASFLAGIILFCGSLYLFGATGSRALVLLTPFGGTAFLIGWIALALAGWRIGTGPVLERDPPRG